MARRAGDVGQKAVNCSFGTELATIAIDSLLICTTYFWHKCDLIQDISGVLAGAEVVKRQKATKACLVTRLALSHARGN